MRKSIDQNHVSDADKALREFNKNTPDSAAQARQREKYKQIFQQRDQIQAAPTQEDDDIWA